MMGLRSIGNVRVKICPKLTEMKRGFSSTAVEMADPPDQDAFQPGQSAARHTTSKEKIQPMNVNQAVQRMKSSSWAKFDETVEMTVETNLDPRKPNQAVKGTTALPYGTGKSIRVCVFATGNEAKAATEAGAEVVGDEDLVTAIQAGNLNFDTVIATPDMMSVVGKLGRILGPRGLMPNPKMGTVTRDTGKAVQAAKAGTIKFKVEKKGIIQAGLGKLSFSDEAILANIRSYMLAIIDAKPEGLKGKYLKAAHLSSTMGPGIPLELSSVDPGSARFMLDLAENTR